MFISKKDLKELKDRLIACEIHLQTLEGRSDNFAECEVCKCQIHKSLAIKGKSEIRKRILHLPFRMLKEKECIYTPYYCHACAPKKDSTDEEKKNEG